MNPDARAKNTLIVAAAVAVAVVLAVGLWFFQRSAPPQTETAKSEQPVAPIDAALPKILVLPFANSGADRREEYFSDGITSDMTAMLARIPGILVIARNTSFAYKGRPIDVQRVGRDVGARYVLEGGVQKLGDRLLLEARLTDTQTGAQLWAEKFDRPLAEVLVALGELEEKITGSLMPDRENRDREKALSISPATLDAYVSTMRARFLLDRSGDRDNSTEARAALEQAVERDPAFAQAYAYLAIALDRFRVNRWTDEYGTAEIAERGLAAAAKAVSLAPSDPVAQAMLGRVLTANGQFEPAVAAAEEALKLSPNDADTIAAAATIMRRSGKFAETVDLVKRARTLDPYINPQYVGTTMGLSLYVLGRNAEAEEAARFCLMRSPVAQSCRQILIAVLATVGHDKDAKAEAAELLRAAPGFKVSTLVQQMLPSNRNATDVEKFAAGLRKAGLPN